MVPMSGWYIVRFDRGGVGVMEAGSRQDLPGFVSIADPYSPHRTKDAAKGVKRSTEEFIR